MPKFSIDHDEWWPVYSLAPVDSGDSGPVEVSEDEYADYKRVRDEFDAWQAKLAGMRPDPKPL